MFDIKAKKWTKHFQNFDDKDIEEFAYRLAGYLRKVVKQGGDINTNRVLRGMFILDDIASRKEVEAEDVFDFSKTKQKHLRDFAKEIWEEHSVNGHGAQHISTLILKKHKKKISKTAIRSWIMAQEEFRAKKEEKEDGQYER